MTRHTKALGGIAGAAACAALLLASPALAAPGRIATRQENQQDRIANGVKSGQLTARETARLERREARLNGEVHRLRQADGGTLTPGQRARVERQQDRLSHQIYRQKHDGQTQPN